MFCDIVIPRLVYGEDAIVKPVKNVKSLKQKSKDALTDKKYALAISYLNKMLKTKIVEDRAFALEYLGVAKERSYQLAFAKRYYLLFLKEFSNLKEAKRVKQRLQSLLGIQSLASQERKKLKKGRRNKNKSSSTTRGSLSASYRKSDLVNDLGEKRETLSLVGTDVDIRGDYRLDSSSIKLRLSAGHYEDLTDDSDSTNDRLSYANISWQTNDGGYRVDIGRQRNRRKGLFNRFDGVVFSYGVNDSETFNFYAGYPVSSSKVLSLDSERQFVGASYDWNDIFENIDVSFFLLNQTISDLTDRRAIGGEVKYINNRTSIFSLLDYDVFHNELNAFLLSGSYSSKEKVRYNWYINQRKSPYISTRNALIGQPANSLEELQNLFLSDDEILDLALDRTLESQSVSLQVSVPLSKTYEISSNINWLDISGAPESGGVSEIINRDAQIYFNTYLRGSKLYSKSDSSQLGVRISKLATSDVWSLYVSSKYRWKRAWSFSGKVRYDDRTNENGSGQQNISPSVRLQFQKSDHFIYTELGAILYTNQIVGFGELSTDIYYMYLGYQFYF